MATPSHLIWKPLVINPLRTNQDAVEAAVRPPRDDVHERTTWDADGYFAAAAQGTEATDTFTVADLEPGVSVLAGRTTSGYWEYGVVMDWEPGKFIRYDGSQVGSLLWRDFLLLRGPLAAAAQARYRERYGPREEGEESPTVPMQRTDSGTSYGFSGHPDVAFWRRSGIEPFYVVTRRHYQPSFFGGPSYRELEGELEMLEDLDRTGMPAEQARAVEYQVGCVRAELASLAAAPGVAQ